MNKEREKISDNSIFKAFSRAAEKHPSKTAIVFESREWRFRELVEGTNRVAVKLQSYGLVKGDRVIAYAKNSDAYLLLWLACVRNGLVHVPINFGLTPGEVSYIVENADAKAIFYDLSLSSTVAKLDKSINLALYGTLHQNDGNFDAIDFDILKVASSNHSASPTEIVVKDNDLAQIIYTSGTTAAPKGAVHTHRSIMLQYYSCIVALDLKFEDRLLAALPLYHCAQMHTFSMPSLLMGASNYILQSPEISQCMEMISKEKLNSFFAPPTVWAGLLNHENFNAQTLQSLKKAYYGASIMPEQTLNKITEKLPDVGFYNCYGQTELAPLATVLSPEQHNNRPTSVGLPVLNVETRIVDETMRECPIGEMGEIAHRSPQTLNGYWKNETATAKAFKGGWFHSGDMAYRDEGGFIFISDRIKDIINTGGVVVSSREVEEAIHTHPQVSQVAVIAVDDDKWIEAICAVVVLIDDAQIDDRALNDYLRDRLAPYKIPKKYVFVCDLPVNSAGKILKRELRDRYR